MSYKVSFSDNAEKDLFEIYTYVYDNDGEINADYLKSKLQSKCFELQELPVRGHTPPELQSFYISDFLEIHFKSYRIIYQVRKTEVLIHGILDGRRDIKKILEERLLR
jgi:toxin ParE1/3/4